MQELKPDRSEIIEKWMINNYKPVKSIYSKYILQILKYKLALVSLILFPHFTSNACTVFNKSNGDTVLFGNVENSPEDWTAKLLFIPPNKTTGNFGYFYIYLENNIAGGMNDQGLCFDVAGLPQHNIQSLGRSASDLLKYMLTSCSTVEDVRNYLETHYWPAFSSTHLMVMDKTGASLIIEQIGDTQYFFQKGDRSQVMTNYSLADPDLRYGNYPCDRYTIANSMLDSMSLTADNMQKICEKVQSAYYQALYATIYDPEKMEIYVFDASRHCEMTAFNLIDEYNKGAHYYTLKDKNIVSGISKPDVEASPVTVNSQNPFYSEISFSLNLLNHAEVNISVLDICGRTVTTLDAGCKNPGSYSYVWQAESYPGGTYFCRVIIDGIIETRKWIKQ